MMDSVERFSNRVENYVKYRPSYPPAILDFMRAELDFSAASVVADIGAGTGKLSELFLDNGNPVYAVEPNEAMRAAAVQAFGARPNFHPLAATAEATTLPDETADFITAGQAFHWFDARRAGVEFRRILRPGGTVLLIWNEWREDTPFMKAYQQIVDQYALNYSESSRRRTTQDDPEARLAHVIGDYQVRRFDNVQLFDFAGLKGRLLSSSYTPLAGHPSYEPMLAALQAIFDRYQQGSVVHFGYECNVYYGRPD